MKLRYQESQKEEGRKERKRQTLKIIDTNKQNQNLEHRNITTTISDKQSPPQTRLCQTACNFWYKVQPRDQIVLPSFFSLSLLLSQ